MTEVPNKLKAVKERNQASLTKLGELNKTLDAKSKRLSDVDKELTRIEQLLKSLP